MKRLYMTTIIKFNQTNHDIAAAVQGSICDSVDEAIGQAIAYAEEKFPSTAGWVIGGKIEGTPVAGALIDAAYAELHPQAENPLRKRST